MSKHDRNARHKPGGYEPAHVYDVDTESKSVQPAQYKRYSILSPAEWLIEILTSLASLVLLAGIAVIFWYVDGKPLSAWPDYISLNAAISILTTACSAAIMHGVSEFISQLKWLHFKDGPHKLEHFEKFDGASRGPWGSLKFLTTVKWNLATIGAVITIGRLGFAPLAQQVVKIDDRLVTSPDDRVTFGYAHAYDRDNSRELANTGIRSIPQDPKLQAAIMQGLYNITTLATFNCPGACTWQGSYISLGFKSECRNVTQATLASEQCSTTAGTSLTQCNMTTPGGLGISTRHTFTDYQTTYWMNASSTMEEFQTTLPDMFPAFVRFAVYKASADHNFIAFNPNVTECDLSLTAYEYTNAQANGSTFAFGGVREVDFGVDNPWQLLTAEMPWRLVSRRIAAAAAAAAPAAANQSSEAADGDGTVGLTMSWTDFRAIQNFFESEAIVSEWVDGNWKNTNLGVSAALGGDVDVGERLENMAARMTDYLRSGPNMNFARGERMDREPFVSIRWVYLVGPAAIELASLLFAAFTVATNRKSRGVPMWKSSALAALNCTCTHTDEADLIQSDVKDIHELRRRAEKTLVRLE